MGILKDGYHAKGLDQFYDHAYYHGVTSGYSAEGYENDHADWTSWIKWAKSAFSGPIRWLDIGCAYGYLIEQARAAGIECFGMDVSTYALHRRETVRPCLLQGLAESLPFPNASLDIISLFDVVEHLRRPSAVFEEIHRVLKPQGLCLITTPDPIRFNRPEPSHIHERPASYWIHALNKLGIETALRFGSQPFEIEILAGKEKSIHFDSFAQEGNPAAKKLQRQGDELYFIPRVWSDPDSIQTGCESYVLNPSANPQRISVSLTASDQRHPDLFLGNLKLHYTGADSTGGQLVHRWEPTPLIPGGQPLTLQTDGGPIEFEQLSIHCQKIEVESLLQELPFDHYQRYRMASEIVKRLEPSPKRVLDVGGALGFLPLFLPEQDVTVLDVAWEDTPQSVGYSGSVLPFGEASFDVVVSVDTLEHIPKECRSSFYAELMRVSKSKIVLACPFNDPSVIGAEAVVQSFIQGHLGNQDRFLDEHSLYTLPDFSETRAYFKKQGFSVMDMPNGYLPRWLGMQLANFSLGVAPEQQPGKARLNALYNAFYFREDNRTPAYRTVLLISREPLAASFKAALGDLLPKADANAPGESWTMAPLVAALANHSVIREKDRLISRQSGRLDRFLEHLQNLESLLQKETDERARLHEHSENLNSLLQAQQGREKALQDHSDNLSTLLQEQQKEAANYTMLYQELVKHIKNLEDLLAQQQAEKQALQTHSENLAHLLQEQKAEFQNYTDLNRELTRHVQNLESLLDELKRHGENLTALLQERDGQITRMQEHIRNLESNQDEWRTHAKNLEAVIAHEQQNSQSIQTHAGNLEHVLQEKEKHIGNLEAMNRETEQQTNQLLNRLQIAPGAIREETMEAIVQAFQQKQEIIAQHEQHWESVKSTKAYKIAQKMGLVSPKQENPPS